MMSPCTSSPLGGTHRRVLRREREFEVKWMRRKCERARPHAIEREETVLEEEEMEVVVERKVNNRHCMDAPDYASTETSSTTNDDDDDDNEGCQSHRSSRPSSWC